MGSILNPVDNNSFVELVTFKNEDIFVDKTDFIPKITPQIRKNRHSSYAPCVLLKSLCRTKYF